MQLEMLDSEPTLLNQAKIVLANTEIVRIEKLIKKATKRFSDLVHLVKY